MRYASWAAAVWVAASGAALAATDEKPQGQEAIVTSETKGVLQAGDRAPAFSLAASTGSKMSLADQAGKLVVLYFYPKADTPGCTKEACGFRDALADYDRQKIVVLGVSPDPAEDVAKFSNKYHLNFPLLADADHAVCEAYGVWQKKGERMGAARTTFVVGRDGKILHTFEAVKPEGHDKEVLAWIHDNVK